MNRIVFFFCQLVSMTAFRRLNAFDRNQQNLWQKLSVCEIQNIAPGTPISNIHAYFALSNFWNACYHWIVWLLSVEPCFQSMMMLFAIRTTCFVLMRNPQWTMWCVFVLHAFANESRQRRHRRNAFFHRHSTRNWNLFFFNSIRIVVRYINAKHSIWTY